MACRSSSGHGTQASGGIGAAGAHGFTRAPVRPIHGIHPGNGFSWPRARHISLDRRRRPMDRQMHIRAPRPPPYTPGIHAQDATRSCVRAPTSSHMLAATSLGTGRRVLIRHWAGSVFLCCLLMSCYAMLLNETSGMHFPQILQLNCLLWSSWENSVSQLGALHYTKKT
jgi:hypothetical protein